jgi:hypothetical protein
LAQCHHRRRGKKSEYEVDKILMPDKAQANDDAGRAGWWAIDERVALGIGD